MLEGEDIVAVELWRLPCWDDVERLADGIVFKEALSGSVSTRAIAFGFGSK